MNYLLYCPALEPLKDLLARLRVARGMTQADLAMRVGVSIGTIFQVEQGRGRKWRQSVATAIYQVLGKARPLKESEARDFFEQTGLDFGHDGRNPPPRPPGRLRDSELLMEAAKGLVEYPGSFEHQRPPQPKAPKTWSGYPAGSATPVTVVITPALQQLLNDLVATVGHTTTEMALNQVLTFVALVRARDSSSSVQHQPAVEVEGFHLNKLVYAAPKRSKVPRGAVATPPQITEGVKHQEFIPATPKPRVADPAKPKATPIKKKKHG